MKSTKDTQPFWEDDNDGYRYPMFLPGAINSIIIIYGILFSIVVFTTIFVLLYEIIHPILAWLFLLYLGVGLGFGFYKRKRNQLMSREIISIQENAKSRTGAVEIGSAIHVAGHPLMDREQPVVLALIDGKGLCFYKYDNDQPVDTLPLEGIISLYTVVYDDERTPHIDAVDSTAQALQIVFKRDGIEFTALLRSMKKLRPIDWYHTLQKSRLK